MNLILLKDNDFVAENQVLLQGRRFEHITKILKAEPGKILRVGLLAGKMGQAVLVEASKDQVQLNVSLEADPPPPAPVDLIVALPRPKSLPKIIQTITSLGVKRVAFINCWKVEKCFWSSDYLGPQSVEKSILLGLEQAVDTRPPRVEFFRLFKPFVEDSLPQWASSGEKWLCHPHVSKSRGKNSEEGSSSRPHHTLALGPEGGFIDYEIDQFCRQGFKKFSLTPRVLRLETAIPALVSRFL